MIVCNTKYDSKVIRKYKDDANELRAYALSLVPDIYKHNGVMCSNQIYYIYTRLLEEVEITKEVRRAANSLVSDIRIAGYLDYFTSISDVERYVDENVIREIHNKEEK